MISLRQNSKSLETVSIGHEESVPVFVDRPETIMPIGPFEVIMSRGLLISRLTLHSTNIAAAVPVTSVSEPVDNFRSSFPSL